ncbi:MAG: hypothetical protein QGF59_21380 [Pirellulaceae bacterium]|jgi:hypothetical protein|nr:hypothetical protein [Pirellulaceae bacterium]
MSREPKFNLYSEARCTGDRPEIAAVQGQRVMILSRSLGEDGEWAYTVSTNKTSPSITCVESELVTVEPIPLISDDEFMSDIVDQTATLRHSVKWDGLRQLLSQRGYDAQHCLLISCDHGSDVAVTLVLPDGTPVAANFREDAETRQATHFEDWETVDYSDSEIELCRQILASDTAEFDRRVRAYFDEHLAATDAPLPAKEGYRTMQAANRRRQT